MNAECPLVVPEVNPHDLRWHKGIIANPNCSTIQMVVVLKPLHDRARIQRVVVSTYQAASGAGKRGFEELRQQTSDVLNDRPANAQAFSHQLAFNVIPHIDDAIEVTATCVRVPVFFSHSESVNIQTERKLTVEEARALLQSAPGVTLVDDLANLRYPMPIDAAHTDDTFVGRIREDFSIDNGLNLWIVADNIRKGAALNAVQIAERLVADNLVRVP